MLLIEQLSGRGFALVTVRDRERAQALREALAASAMLEGFRFPPINTDEVHYREVHRGAFRALFATAIDCLRALAPQLASDAPTSSSALATRHPELFKRSPHEPFTLDHAFHPTFFNLFNYDHGALNEHRDRGLITLIHLIPAAVSSAAASDAGEASALWVEDRAHMWSSADEAVRVADGALCDPTEHIMVLLLGEDGEEVLSADHPELFAAEHSVRVAPVGDYIERSHHQRDPTSRTHNNRLSAAMILKRRST